MKRKPQLRQHTTRNLAYVNIDGRQRYLGKWASPEAAEAYDAVLLEWRRQTDQTGKYTTTIGELCVAFLRHADSYYRDDNGTPTREADNFRYALRPLVDLFRSIPASEFCPVKLEDVRNEMVRRGNVRTSINKRVHRIRQMFKWGASKRMVTSAVYNDLRMLAPLKRGRTTAEEPDPVLPVPDADIDAIKPHVTPTVWAMIQTQLLTGMRPKELRLMRWSDIDRTGAVWLYEPHRHKTRHHGKRRVIFIGPRAQLALRPFLCDDSTAYVFPSPKGGGYTHHGYDASIRRACKKAGVDPWSPGRLRHNTGTNISREFGDIDAARVALGHSAKGTTEIYAERDLEAARDVMLRVG